MNLNLEPMGKLVLHVDQSWSTPGPIWVRSCTTFKYATWSGEQLNLRSLWGNGSYMKGADVAEVNVRVLFEDDEGTRLYLDYVVRTDMPLHEKGEAPAIMSGRFEVDDRIKRYAWLNRTHVVGKAFLNYENMTQNYDMYVLRW
jgi:hypothetical protein